MMVWMLNIIEPEHTWAHRLKSLLNEYSSIDPDKMGFVTEWEKEAIWQ